MKLGIYYEQQLPRPWDENAEYQLYQETLDQIELADRLGYDHAWFVEHKFLEEYSHSSAPGMTLAAASQRTEQIRLGHGIRLMPPPYNAPQRVAEMASALDLISDGRLELGTGESSSRQELEGYGFKAPDHRIRDKTHAMWEEATKEVADMMTMEPYPGYDGEFFSMPPRNVIPKPRQKPHPPLWVACSNEDTIKDAARKGIGALVITYGSPEEAGEWVDLYYDTLKEECLPIGHAVNPNIVLVMTGFGVAHDEEEAFRRGREGALFFQYTANHYYGEGQHINGYTDLWEEFQEEKDDMELRPTAIGTPDQLREFFGAYADQGIDEMAFILTAGTSEHEEICDGLEILAEEVMPDIREGEEERQREKMEELEPYIEEAFERKRERPVPGPDELDPVEPYERDFERDDFRAEAQDAGWRGDIGED